MHNIDFFYANFSACATTLRPVSPCRDWRCGSWPRGRVLDGLCETNASWRCQGGPCRMVQRGDLRGRLGANAWHHLDPILCRNVGNPGKRRGSSIQLGELVRLGGGGGNRTLVRRRLAQDIYRFRTGLDSRLRECPCPGGPLTSPSRFSRSPGWTTGFRQSGASSLPSAYRTSAGETGLSRRPVLWLLLGSHRVVVVVGT